eukprot:UN28370
MNKTIDLVAIGKSSRLDTKEKSFGCILVQYEILSIGYILGINSVELVGLTKEDMEWHLPKPNR